MVSFPNLPIFPENRKRPGGAGGQGLGTRRMRGNGLKLHHSKSRLEKYILLKEWLSTGFSCPGMWRSQEVFRRLMVQG